MNILKRLWDGFDRWFYAVAGVGCLSQWAIVALRDLPDPTPWLLLAIICGDLFRRLDWDKP